MGVRFVNNARSRLVNSISSSATVAFIKEGDYPDFLSAGTGDMFVIFRNTTQREIVKVSVPNSSAANGLDIQRGQDGSTATSFPRGTVVYQALTATVLERFVDRTDIKVHMGADPMDLGYVPRFTGEFYYSGNSYAWWRSTSTTATGWVRLH